MLCNLCLHVKTLVIDFVEDILKPVVLSGVEADVELRAFQGNSPTWGTVNSTIFFI